MLFSFNSSYFKLCHTNVVSINQKDTFLSGVLGVVWSMLAVTQEVRKREGVTIL